MNTDQYLDKKCCNSPIGSLLARFTLNDHGLFYSGTKDRVMEASNEREVFDRLELVYKEPHERDCFDAVVGKEGPLEIELSQREFSQDRDYVWVN